MPEEIRKHGITYFVLVRQKPESGRALTPSSSRGKGRAGSPATAFPGPASAACTLLISWEHIKFLSSQSIIPLGCILLPGWA